MKNLLLSIIFLSAIASGYSQSLPNYWVPSSGTNTYSTNINGFGTSSKIAYVQFGNTNTGASTLSINQMTARPIRKWNGVAWVPLAGGEIRTDRDYRLSYDNTNGWFRLELSAMPLGGMPSLTDNLDIAAGSNKFSITGDYSTFELPQDGVNPINILSSTGLNLADGVGAGFSYQSADGLGNAVSATIFPNSYTVAGPSGFAGIQYDLNYGADFTARSIPDVGFLDGRYTSSQGITKTGTNFTLGGTFSSNINLNSNTANTNSFTIGGTTRPNTIQFLAGDVVGNNSGAITINSTTTSIARTTTNPMSIVLSTSGMVVTDLAYTKGLTYAADYSANYTDRSIPDVGWINSTKAPLYMQPVTHTANWVATTTDIGKIVYMDVVSPNTFTINSGVFPVGTFLNVRVLNAATTAVQGASVTINPQSGSLVLNPNAINVFYQRSTNVWELYNGATFAYTDATLSSDVTVTTTGHTWTFTGGDFIATDGTRKFQLDAGSGIQLNLGSDATGDIYYRNSSGYLQKLGIGTDGHVLKVASGVPSWAAESGGVTDGDKGDITVTGGTWNIDAGSVSYSDIQNTAGGTRVLGRSSASAGGIQEIVFTANGQTLIRNSSGILAAGALPLDDTDAVSGVLPPANGGSLSGTYTPTLTGELNVDATTAYQCQYSRAGNMVTVSGVFDCDVTSSASTTQIGISLPPSIPSNFSLASNCGGTSAGFGINTAGAVLADPSNDRAQITWLSTTTTNNTYTFQFSYLVQ